MAGAGPPTPRRLVLLLLWVLGDVATAQDAWLTASGAASESSCPLDEYRGRISTLDAACCGGEDGEDICPLSGAPTECTPLCAAKLEETLGDCSITMRSSFDALDGAGDDAAAAATTGWACLTPF